MAFSTNKNADHDQTKRPPLWDDNHRRAAIGELEDRFRMRITEQEVFQAAALFFGLLRDGVFIDKEAVSRRMQQEFALAGGADDEPARRNA